jgi:hypothetical protein
MGDVIHGNFGGAGSYRNAAGGDANFLRELDLTLFQEDQLYERLFGVPRVEAVPEEPDPTGLTYDEIAELVVQQIIDETAKLKDPAVIAREDADFRERRTRMANLTRDEQATARKIFDEILSEQERQK